MLNTKRLVICCSFRTIRQTQILTFTDQRRSHSLTSVKCKGNPPVCTTSPAFQYWKWRQLVQTTFSGSTKSSSKADHGMTVLTTLLILRKRNPFSFWMTIKTKKLILYQNIVLSAQNLGGGICPPCLPLATALESIHRKALRIIYRHVPYHEALQLANLDSLSSRRTIACKNFAKNCVKTGTLSGIFRQPTKNQHQYNLRSGQSHTPLSEIRIEWTDLSHDVTSFAIA